MLYLQVVRQHGRPYHGSRDTGMQSYWLSQPLSSMKPPANLLQYRLRLLSSQSRKKGDGNNIRDIYTQSTSKKTYLEVHNHKILLSLKSATSFCATLLIWSITAVTFLTCFFFALLQLDAGGKTLIVGWPPSISHGVWDECVQVQTPWRKEFLHSETHIHLRPRATPSKPAQTIIGSDYANGHFQNGKPPQFLAIGMPFSTSFIWIPWSC